MIPKELTMTFSGELPPDTKEVLEQLLHSDEMGLYAEWPDGTIRQVATLTRAEGCPPELFHDIIKRLRLGAPVTKP